MEKVKQLAKKIQPIYEMLGWTWWREGGEIIPSVEQIEENLLRFIRDIKGDTTCMSSGGLFAQKDTKTGFIEFGFQLDDFVEDNEV